MSSPGNGAGVYGAYLDYEVADMFLGRCFWTTVAESQYPWERDSLDFVR